MQEPAISQVPSRRKTSLMLSSAARVHTPEIQNKEHTMKKTGAQWLVAADPPDPPRVGTQDSHFLLYRHEGGRGSAEGGRGSGDWLINGSIKRLRVSGLPTGSI